MKAVFLGSSAQLLTQSTCPRLWKLQQAPRSSNSAALWRTLQERKSLAQGRVAVVLKGAEHLWVPLLPTCDTWGSISPVSSLTYDIMSSHGHPAGTPPSPHATTQHKQHSAGRLPTYQVVPPHLQGGPSREAGHRPGGVPSAS